MIDLRKLAAAVDAEREAAAAAERLRTQLYSDVAALRAECSLRGVATMLTLANISSNLRGFDGSFSLSVARDCSECEFIETGGIWGISWTGEFESEADLDSRAAGAEWRVYSTEVMLGDLLCNLDMVGSVTATRELAPLVDLFADDPECRKLGKLLNRIPYYAVIAASAYGRELAAALRAPDVEAFVSVLLRQAGTKTKAQDLDTERFGLVTKQWEEFGGSPEALLGIHNA
jgi:hypothetical protein